MSKTYHIYSRLASSVTYNDFTKGGGDMPVKGRSVTINGGAGVARKNLVTPVGLHTEVSAEDMELLNANDIFNLHKNNGFISVQDRQVDVEKVTADMSGNDKSAPLTPSDYEAEPDNAAKPAGTKKNKG